jgi:alpha-tubulin suppressor-like RCC1 family protein
MGGYCTEPVQLVGLDGMEEEVVKICGGFNHTCALMSGGTVYCWGSNQSGQLGNGEMGDDLADPAPGQVIGLEGLRLVDISCGNAHTCALVDDGTVWCWGSSWQGSLGNGSWSDSPIPVQVVGLDEWVVAIGTGCMHSCAITASGRIWCWGFNQHGQLGDGTEDNSNVPVQVIWSE